MLFKTKKKAATPKIMTEREMWDLALHYDRDWVESTFRDALEYYYDKSRLDGNISLVETVRRYNERVAS